MAVILIAFIRSRGKPEGETGEGAFGVQKHDSTRRCDNPSLQIRTVLYDSHT